MPIWADLEGLEPTDKEVEEATERSTGIPVTIKWKDGHISEVRY